MNKHDPQIYGYHAVQCHMCKGTKLNQVLDLGHQPHSDDFVEPERLDEVEHFFPLRLMSCSDCGLLQIDYFVNPKILYQTNYVYESSITKTGVSHYMNMSKSIAKRFGYVNGSRAVDIGSNVGVLLQSFKDSGYEVVGVDPAEVPAQKAIDSGIPTVIDFFNYDVAESIVTDYGPAKVITGTNVFAHLHDLESAMKGVKVLLDTDGVFVIEAPYALSLVEQLEYDTIYHQHIGYLSVLPMQKYFEQFDMELFDVEFMSIHGGSIRYFVSHKGVRSVMPAVNEYIEKEKDFGLYDMDCLRKFEHDVIKHRAKLVSLLQNLIAEGKTVAGISAPAKGNTLLNFCGIDAYMLPFTTERSQFKQGKYTPGTHIPILNDEELLKRQPDYALILAWNFADEIMKNLDEYSKKGGKFIIPIPEPLIK